MKRSFQSTFLRIVTQIWGKDHIAGTLRKVAVCSKRNWQEQLFSCSGRNHLHSPASWRTTFSRQQIMHTVLSQNCLLLKRKTSGCQKAVVGQSISGSAHLAIAYRTQTGPGPWCTGWEVQCCTHVTEDKESINKGLFGLILFQKAFYFL